LNLEDFKSYCTAKKGVEENYPFKGEAVWMKVMGKMFAMANVQAIKMDKIIVEPFHFVNVKCDPERAVGLREKFGAIIPAWHQSKIHWNTILMDGSLSDEFVYELIDHSYELVISSLPKNLKSELNEL
jgi:predicted DNA-binding protein (MmcQ/YjbR family)